MTSQMMTSCDLFFDVTISIRHYTIIYDVIVATQDEYTHFSDVIIHDVIIHDVTYDVILGHEFWLPGNGAEIYNYQSVSHVPFDGCTISCCFIAVQFIEFSTGL